MTDPDGLTPQQRAHYSAIQRAVWREIGAEFDGDRGDLDYIVEVVLDNYHRQPPPDEPAPTCMLPRNLLRDLIEAGECMQHDIRTAENNGYLGAENAEESAILWSRSVDAMQQHISAAMHGYASPADKLLAILAGQLALPL